MPQLKEGLGQLERYIHDENPADPAMVRLALIHYQFEALHPFRDGNGRVGRLLIPLLMCSWERLDAPILYVSAFFERHRGTYVDLLLRVSQEGDWIAWIDRLFQTPSMTIKQASELLDMTHQGAANNIHRLEHAGILREVTGQKRDQVFVADGILSFMYDST